MHRDVNSLAFASSTCVVCSLPLFLATAIDRDALLLLVLWCARRRRARAGRPVHGCSHLAPAPRSTCCAQPVPRESQLPPFFARRFRRKSKKQAACLLELQELKARSRIQAVLCAFATVNSHVARPSCVRGSSRSLDSSFSKCEAYVADSTCDITQPCSNRSL